MKTPSNFFFLLISPPPEVIEYVAFLKKLVRESIGHTYSSFYSTAHVTLLQYYDFHNESRLYTIQERISDLEPFQIHIDGFNVFRNNGTIFLDIKYPYNIRELGERLGQSISCPHITIAKRLPGTDLELALRAVQNFSWNCHFICNCVTVLKRINNRWTEHLELSLGWS